jgi:ubiquinone/menaquinone biosynthesis C-methylase UbiE
MKKLEIKNIPVSQEVAAGAAIYTKFTLLFYDLQVMYFENRFVFKCPTRNIINFYNRNISNKHLDVGVGTGYFLDKCTFSSNNPTIHLMDLNFNSLQRTAKRIKRYNPVIHQWNILELIRTDLPLFDSICISNILHCLPGDFDDKEIVFINLKRFLSSNGTMFGLTILGENIRKGILYKIFNNLYNKYHIFSNKKDNIDKLEKILKSNFRKYELEVIGSVAFFICKL